MKSMEEKLFKNALIGERLIKLDKVERQKIITKLLSKYSERELAEQIGVPHSTIHDWKTLRQDNTGGNIHISLNTFYRKIVDIKPEDINDWGRLE